MSEAKKLTELLTTPWYAPSGAVYIIDGVDKPVIHLKGITREIGSCEVTFAYFIEKFKTYSEYTGINTKNTSNKATTAEEFVKRSLQILEERGAENGADGKRENSFQAVADSFTAKTRIKLTAAHVALILQDLKDVRQFAQERLHYDSMLDCVTYAALKAELLSTQFNEQAN